MADLLIEFIGEVKMTDQEEFYGPDEVFEPEEEELMDSQDIGSEETPMDSQDIQSAISNESQKTESQSTSSDFEIDRDELNYNMVPLDKKIKMFNLHREHPNWKLETLKSHGGRILTRIDDLIRWKKDIINGGTQYDKLNTINKFTFSKFYETREKKIPVTSRNLQEWALQSAQQFRDQSTFSFVASETWLANFKRKYRIVQRKVTKLVKQTQQRSVEELHANVEKFQAECREITSSSNLDFVINTDQMGCEYRTDVKRTLETKGTKTVDVYIGDVNKVTHTYSVQYSVTASGKLLPKVFICLQEPTGKFGPKISKQMEDMSKQFKNVYITCSKSGKLTTELIESYIQHILQPYVKQEDFTLILDSWSGQKKNSLFDCFKTSTGNSTCNLKYIPPGCTEYCQPLDTYIHRQMKYFIKRLQNATYLIQNQRQINTRVDSIKIHSILHHQLTAPVFKNMLEYAWFSAKLIENRDVFCSVKQVCFPPKLSACDNCHAVSFIKCSWCREAFCFSCFYDSFHPLNCSQYFVNI